ncbi:hypothetical protein P405_07360 [Streptomyces sp. FR-008]|nr:hypothetical protein P405_07360 [Streptomyces sp. FR-008]
MHKEEFRWIGKIEFIQVPHFQIHGHPIRALE